MAWRNASYAYAHAGRTAGAGAITTVGSVDSSFPIANLIDDRMTVPFKWTDSTSAHTIIIDLGAGWPTGFDRLYIPFGHNLNGAHILIQDDDAIGFPSAAELLADTTISSTAAIDLPFDTASTQQFLRVSFITTSGAWEIGQLWITETISLTQGPVQQWVDELVPNVLQFDDGSTVQEDVDQRFVEYTYRALGRTAADLTAIEALVAAVSTYRPFLLDSLYDVSDGGYTKVMKLTQGADARHDSPVPRREDRKKQITLSMLEHLL